MNKKIILAISVSSFIVLIILIIYAQKTFQNKAQNEPISATASFICDGNKHITADFYNGESQVNANPNQPPILTGSVNLIFDNKTQMHLNQTISADGARYSNTDESFVFWSKGSGAMVLQNNKEQDYKNCIIVAKNPNTPDLPKEYANSKYGFSIRLPKDYTIDENYEYQMNPTQTFPGVKFTIPESEATGTNLGSDTYLSIEQKPNASKCEASMFLDDPLATSTQITENGIDYSFAASTGAGAGNRYEETVYSFPTMTSCMAVRYFIHYGVIENYPPGAVQEFNKQKILNEFDAIRKTLNVL